MSDTGHNSNSSPLHPSIRQNVSPLHSNTVHISRPTWRVNSNENVALDESEALSRSQVKLSNTRSRGPHRNRGPPSRLNLPLGRQDSTLSNSPFISAGEPLVSTSEAGAPTGSTLEVFSSNSDRSVPLTTFFPSTSPPVLPTTSGSDVSAPTLSTASSHQPGPPQGISSQVKPPPTSRQAPESNPKPSTSRGALSSPTFSTVSSSIATTTTPVRGTPDASTGLSATLSLTLIGTSTTTSIPPLTTTTTISTTDTSPTMATPPTITSTTFNSQTTTTTTTTSGSPALTTSSTPTMGTTSSTSVELTPTFTSSNSTLSPPASTGVIVSTTFDVSSTTEPIPQSATILSSTLQPTPEVTSTTISLQFTSDLPGLASQSATITLDIPLSPSVISTSTYTKYWTTTNSGGLIVTYSSAIGTGVLGTDNSHPGGLAHNTGAIIGVALAGTFTVIISVFIIFFACKRYKQKNDKITGSRENFLSRDGGAGVSVWRPPLDDDEFESGYDHRRLQSGAAVTMEGDGVTRQLPAGPISYSTYPYDSADGGENSGGRNGGFSGDASADSAMMYPAQRQSEPEYWPNAAQIGLALPYQNPQELASGCALDPFGDDYAAMDAGISRSMTGHGHQSNDAIASSMFFGSSSHGHLVTAGAAQSSSSGHDIGDGGRKSKSDSPVGERNQFPPSSYVPPGRPRIGGSDGNISGSGSDHSSIKGLFGKLKSMSKDIMKEKNRRSRLQHQDSRGPGLSRSSGESITSRPSMSMSLGHSSGPGHTSLTSHHGHEYSYYGMPSSLLNPPKPIPMAMPTSHLPPVPVIRQSEPALTTYPYLTSDPYPLHLVQDNLGHGFEPTSDSPYVDTWTPPMIFCSSPSPPPTETSSYVEGLLNPHMLPSSTGGLGLPSLSVARSSGAGSDGSLRGYSFGMSKDGGESVMSLRDNVDYSRPISGAVMHKSTTTFGTDVESASIATGGTIGRNGSVGVEMERHND